MKAIFAAVLCLLSLCASAQFYNVPSSSLVSGWVQDTSTNPVRLYKDAGGVVHLEGLICKSVGQGLCGGGPFSEIVFVLPYGYRPLYDQRIPLTAGLQFATLWIQWTGEVTVITPTGFWLSLSGAYYAP